MIKNYLKLSKFGIVFLVLLTAVLGYSLGPHFSYSTLCFFDRRHLLDQQWQFYFKSSE